MKKGRLQAKDLDAVAILREVHRQQWSKERPCDWTDGSGRKYNDLQVPHWVTRWDLAECIGSPPERVLLAKLRTLIKQGLMTGCACGCRGDLELTEAGLTAAAITTTSEGP